MSGSARPRGAGGPKRPADSVSLERALSKLGFASRSQAHRLIEAGRVRVNGSVARDPALRVDVRRARIEVDGQAVRAERRVYVALHKPRGLVTTTQDERGRDTVYECLANADLPRVVPVGRLDRDSEGLLLFTNDTRWAQRVLDPASHVDKVYEVHIAGDADAGLLAALRAGVTSRGELLRVKAVRRVRAGVLEVTLGEGRNRHIRRMLEGLGREVELLRRVAIGDVQLGRLGPGAHRMLTAAEVEALGGVVEGRRE